MNRTLLIVQCLIFVQILNAQEQCKVHEIVGRGTWSCGFGTVSDVCGQTFTSCQDGLVDSVVVSLDFRSDYTGPVDFFISTDPGEGNIISGEPFQRIEFIEDIDIVYIIPDKPFRVRSGVKYRFEFSLPAPTGNPVLEATRISPNGDYLEGEYVYNGSYESEFDLDFSVKIVSSPNVPTMSEWALVICML